MSVAGILSSSALSIGAQFFQSRAKQTKQEFQQLGADLQSGNLQAAQADFAALQKLQPKSPTSDSTPAAGTVTQDVNQLATDLKAGNITAAQQDVTTLQKDLHTQPPIQPHHRHSAADSDSNTLVQMFSQIGSALQSGDLSAAQQAYSSMLQTFQQYATGGAASSTATSAVSFDV